MQAYRKVGIAVHKTRWCAYFWTHYFDSLETPLDFFPQHSELHFRHTVAHAAMQAEAERNMIARAFTIDKKLLGIFNAALVAVA